MGDTKGTGAHTVMTHGTPTLFPHNTHKNPCAHKHTHTNTHTYTHIQLMHMSLAGTCPSLLHVVIAFVTYNTLMNAHGL